LSTRSPAVGDKLRSGAGWLLAAVLVATYVAMLPRYSVNFPREDDFVQILAVPYYFTDAQTLRGKLAYLFQLSGAHRITTLRLAALVQADFLGGLNFQGLMYFGSALLVVAGAVLIFTVDRAARPLLAAIAAALLLSPANFEATFWVSASQHFDVLGYVFAGLYCVGRRGAGWQAGGMLLVLAAAFTSGNGLMGFPAAVLVLVMMHRWRLAVAWGLLGAALFAVYFIGYEAAAFQLSASDYLRDPIMPLRFFLILLGGLGHEASFALALGVVIAALWVFLAVSGRIRSLPPAWVGWAAFLLLSFAAITWGRANFGDPGALLSRYRVYSEFAALLSVVALFWQLPRARAMRVLWIALPVSLAWFVACWRYDLPALEAFHDANRRSLDYFLAEGHAKPDDLPAQTVREFFLARARELGVYDPRGVAHTPRAPVADPRTRDKTP
jgi:hypothetical protein